VIAILQEPAPVAWSRLIGRGLEYVLLIVADVAEEDVWNPINTFANKLAKEYSDKVGFVYLTYVFLPHPIVACRGSQWSVVGGAYHRDENKHWSDCQ
jgi:hypothetical protein